MEKMTKILHKSLKILLKFIVPNRTDVRLIV